MRPRVVITGIIVFAVVSIVGTVISFFISQLKSNRKADSYGVRQQGHLAFFELMEELEVPIFRRHSPLMDRLSVDDTLILYQPLDSMVESESVFIESIGEWVKSGGRLVVFPRLNADATPQSMPGFFAFGALMQKIGLSGISIDDSTESAMYNPAYDDGTMSGITDDAFSFLQENKKPIREIDLACEGRLKFLENVVSTISIYSNEVATLNPGYDSNGMIRMTDKSSKNGSSENSSSRGEVIAASYELGDGEVIVFSLPCAIENMLIGRNDNAALMVGLTSENRKRIFIDEFFHSSIVRGNVLYLLTRSSYTAILLCMLVTALLWGFREGFFLGPGTKMKPINRRSIHDYVVAMSRFLAKGSGSDRFLLTELRSGLLMMISDEIRVPVNDQNLDKALETLERRNPISGAKVRKSLNEISSLLNRPEKISKNQIAKIVQEYPGCL